MSDVPATIATLVVVGSAPEIGQEVQGARIVRVSAEEAATLVLASTLVFDARTTPLPRLVTLRRRSVLTSVPLLVVWPDAALGPERESLEADDEWSPRDGKTLLRRRIDRLLELDRLRVGMRREVDVLHRLIVDKQRFDHAILDGVEAGIVTTDREGVVTFVNRAATELLGTDRVIHGDLVREVLGLPADPGVLLAAESRRVFAYPLPLPDGAELDLQLAVSRGDNADDDRVGFFFIFRDVREEKQREAERARFERLAAMGTMVAGFAHEVRNPIAAMRSIAEELREELIEAGVDTPHVALLLRMVERVERLVRTSLQFGRPAAPKRASCRPEAIVAAALGELALQNRAIAMPVVEVDSGLGDVVVDESQIAQALVILIHNAIDSTGDAARVVVRACRGRRPESERRRSEPPPVLAVRFEVADDGPGIAPALLERIFDPFFTTKPSGTGLGLSIAQQIVIENRGRLEVASQPGGPTTFSIVFVGS